MDVRTIYRYHAKNTLPVEWCLNEKVELLCKLAMPRLSNGVRMKSKGVAREMVSNCNVGATTYTVCLKKQLNFLPGQQGKTFVQTF